MTRVPWSERDEGEPQLQREVAAPQDAAGDRVGHLVRVIGARKNP